MIPFPRTKTKRREAIGAAKRHLTRASSLLGYDLGEAADESTAVQARVKALLWAEAMIQQALYQETRGRVGNQHATPATILRERARLDAQAAGAAS